MKNVEGKKFGFYSMIFLGINGIIGSGIFLLPGKVMALAGNWSLIVYVFVSLVVLAIAWCFAQCAKLFSRNGGAYIYAKEAFGEFIGFEVGVMRWAIGIIAWASIVVGFITALSSVWSAADQEPIRSLLILGLVGGLGLLNILGVRTIKGLNNLVTCAKILLILCFILFGSVYEQSTYPISFVSDALSLETFGGAALMIFYAFGGFETLVVAAEDMNNPTKNLPLVILIVISFCSLIYFLVHFIAMKILGPALALSITPVADVADKIFGSPGRWCVTVTMLFSIGGASLAASFITPRSGVALAEDHLIPQVIAKRGRFGTPYFAILITVILTGFIALSGSFTQLITISVLSRFIQYISTCLAAMIFHYRQFSFKQVTHIWKFVIPIVALTGITWLLLQASLQQLYMGLGALIVGIPLYFIQKRSSPTEIVSIQIPPS